MIDRLLTTLAIAALWALGVGLIAGGGHGLWRLSMMIWERL